MSTATKAGLVATIENLVGLAREITDSHGAECRCWRCRAVADGEAAVTEAAALLAALVTARWYVHHVTWSHTPVCDCDPCRELRSIDAVIARASGEVSS